MTEKTLIYLDNAATTRVDEAVVAEMIPYFTEVFGNPSSTHAHGNRAKSAIEKARKQVAQFLNVTPSEIFFTSGGTESDNTALRCAISTYQIKNVITSPIEHHAVLHTLEDLAKSGLIQLSFVKLDAKGSVDLSDLEAYLAKTPNALVSLMHGNNEVGNLTDIAEVGRLCELHQALFHSDTVQTLGHFPLDLQKVKAHFIAGSAHKFYGPKGVGILYVKAGTKIQPFQTGGAQERNMRGGTENVASIIGLAKALSMSIADMDAHRQHALRLKSLMIEKLCEIIPDIQFNGLSSDLDNSLYGVLNVSFPPSDVNDMLLFNLDIHNICASAGSACSSGSQIGSHVLKGIGADPNRSAVRFSFGKYNTESEILSVIDALKAIFKLENA